MPFISFTEPMKLKPHWFALLIFFQLAAVPGFTQADSAGSAAQVNVFVSDFKNKSRSGEQIILISQKTGKQFTGVSDKDGKFSIQLPAGDTFIIKVKTIVDSTKYGIIGIPALNEGEYFSEPFTLRVKFEPARSYTLDNVYFDFGKYTLRPESFKELDELFSYLKLKTEMKIEIAGHTDNVGKDVDNLKLSQQRAEAIRQYLIKKGITPARITAKGYGATQPIADNTTDEGRQKNRRTEVRIL